MSDETATMEAPVAVEVQKVAKIKAVKPKAKPAAKKPTPKATPAKAAPKASANGKAKPAKSKAPAPVVREKKKGLRLFQIRILAALSKIPAGAPGLTTEKLAKACKISTAVVGKGLGPQSEESWLGFAETFGYPGLLAMKLVRAESSPDGPTCYAVSASGRKAGEKAVAELDGKLPKVQSAPYSVTAAK